MLEMFCTLSAAMSEIAKILSWLGFTSRLKFQDKVPNYTWPDLQVVEENILVEVDTVIILSIVRLAKFISWLQPSRHFEGKYE